MTISYASDVTRSRRFGCFLHILARWRGSIYQLIWPDVVIYLCLYYVINLTYRYAMDAPTKANFEVVVKYCHTYGSLIPLSFVLGFYVNNIMTRWWNQYCSIPFPDNLAILVSAGISGDDDKTRIIRRTIMRYVCLSFTITLSLISPKVKKRFPTLEHLVQAGLLENDERQVIEDLDAEYPSFTKYWMPLAWAANIASNARYEGVIREDHTVKTILEEINKFRGNLGRLLDHDWISMPLVYTQVVTLAVYSYFLTTLLGQQNVDSKIHSVDTHFPFISVLEFFFYMGWLKVAEVLINPFGEDEEDFEVVWMIDRNVQISFLIVDKMHHVHPALVKDHYWSKIAPNRLPYTVASEEYFGEYPFFSTRNTAITKSDQEIIELDDEPIVESGFRTFFRNLFGGSAPRRRHRAEENVSHVVQEAENINLLSSNLDETITTDVSKGEITNDFELLKQKRQAQHKQKMMTYIELLKKSSEEENLLK